MKTKNVGTAERVTRVVLGGALAVTAAIFVTTGGPSLVLAVVELAGIALGLDFVITGLTGHCPLYKLLGWSTSAPRAERNGGISLKPGH